MTQDSQTITAEPIQGTNAWFWDSALSTAKYFTPTGRRLVLTPLHQDICFDKSPHMNPDGEWLFRAPFKYIPIGDPLPVGWFEAEQGEISPKDFRAALNQGQG